jgi:hypothetical protein
VTGGRVMCDVACIVMVYCNVSGTSDSGVCCADVEDDEVWVDHLAGEGRVAIAAAVWVCNAQRDWRL